MRKLWRMNIGGCERPRLPDAIHIIDSERNEPMRARIDVPLTAAERMALWSGDAADRRSAIATSGADAAVGDGPETITQVVIGRLLTGISKGEANLAKIFAATAHGYRFDDPLVGAFSRWSFPVYFEHLRGRFARAGAVTTRDFAFSIRGPMDGPRRCGRLKFFREAPRLGLSGVTFITIGERGIVAESVAYDLNLASDVLRNPPGDQADQVGLSDRSPVSSA